MRYLVTLSIAILFTGTSLSAQPLAAEMLYQKYRGEEGVVSIWLPGIAMKLAATIADLEHEEAAFLRSIRSMRVLTIENNELYPGVNFAREANIHIGRNGYEVMVQVTSDGEDVLILGREKRGKLKDMLILVGGEDNVMVHIKGRMQADMIGSLAQIAGVEQLGQL
ncbi:MAG: DUF4252 domain-containing protein [Bacteroidales bacterium]|nr:DUF4252 domain-containing protein [Bacteroidales bacterium]MDT8431762.1 DUF4252 domain-containing protein [Bacteroidales bacterium]